MYAKTGLKVLPMDSGSVCEQYVAITASDLYFYLIYCSPNAPAKAMEGPVNLVRKAKKNSMLIGDLGGHDGTDGQLQKSGEKE